MPTIIVKIPKGQPTTITVQGVSGPGCRDLTKALERALGSTSSDTPTREMGERPQEATREQDA